MPLIDSISGLKHGGAFKCVKTLLRHKLLHHDGSKYDGYRLTNMGYDFLAIKVGEVKGTVAGGGQRQQEGQRKQEGGGQ
jgi:RIO kinase 2